MTTLNEAREIVFQRFVQFWTPTGVPYVLQNEDFESEPVNEYARVIVLNLTAGQNTLGSKGCRRFERQAQAIVSVFVKGGTGTGRADELTVIVQNAFEGFTSTPESVTFDDVVVNEIGPDGNLYQYNVVGNFRYYETK